MLLRELEHRVKNNFASVSSMLHLQLRDHKDDPVVAAALQSAMGRVESYALVNSFLYRGSGYTGILNMSEYLTQLCSNLENATTSRMTVSIVAEIAPIPMERDQAVAVGLLVNELVTNAMKHAFRDRVHGQILVRLTGDENEWQLEIADNGGGFVGAAGTGSLGLKLVSALASQIDSSVQINSDADGTKCIFKHG